MPTTIARADLAAFLARCSTRQALIDFGVAHLRRIGVTAMFIQNFRQADGEPLGWQPLYNSFPEEVAAIYAAHWGHRRDPIMRAALQSRYPVRVRDVLRQFPSCQTLNRTAALCSEHGILDGLGMIVVSRPGSFNYVALAFDRSIADLSVGDRCRIQREVEMIGRRLAAIDPLPPKGRLTPGEIQVFQRMMLGASNKEIARDLGVAPATVETLMSRSLQKLQAKSRIEAAVKAVKEGLLVAA
jgi:DNA-binding CsgD family transcriptional regulator